MATVRNAMENADERQRRKLAQQQALNSAAKQPGMVYKTIPGGEPKEQPGMVYKTIPGRKFEQQPVERRVQQPVKQPGQRVVRMGPVQPPANNFNRPVPPPRIIGGLRPMPVKRPSMRPGIPVPPSVRPQPTAGMIPNPNAERPTVPARPAPKPALKPVAPPRKRPRVKRINYGGMR